MPDDKLSHSELLSVWKTAIETQKHFAELSIKMRQLGLTLTGAILAAGLIMLRKDDLAAISIGDFQLPIASLILIAACIVLGVAMNLDVYVYHKMLRGAVKFNEIFEDEQAEKLFNVVGMTQTISAYSRSKDDPVLNKEEKNWEVDRKSRASTKILWFYLAPILLSGLSAMAIIVFANLRGGGANVEESEQMDIVIECEFES